MHRLLAALFSLCLLASSIEAAPAAPLSAEECYAAGAEAFNSGRWKLAIEQFRLVASQFPAAPCRGDALYWLGVSYFYDQEYEFSNQILSDYLATESNPRYYEEAICYKFSIAEAFRKGAKRRLMGYKTMPKCFLGTEIAFEAYEEVVMALPSHPIAAKALFCKGILHWYCCEYREAVDSLNTLIRRFPKDSLASEAYVTLCRIYLEQSEKEFQNPDLLHLANLNFEAFRAAFPTDEKLSEAEALLGKIHEVHAGGLYRTGCFYEKVRHPEAAQIYYRSVIERFPETECARRCRLRLDSLEEGCMLF